MTERPPVVCTSCKEVLAPITISTIGDLIDHEHSLAAHCTECRHFGDIDLQALAARVGRDRRYVGGLPIVCSRCGSRRVSISIGGRHGFRGGAGERRSDGRSEA